MRNVLKGRDTDPILAMAEVINRWRKLWLCRWGKSMKSTSVVAKTRTGTSRSQLNLSSKNLEALEPVWEKK